MKKQIFIFCAIATIALCLTATAFGQVLKVEPAKPKRGDTLIITYDPSAQGATFTLEQSLSVRVFQHVLKIFDPASTQTIPMTKTGKVLSCKARIGIDVHSVEISLLHRGESERNSRQTLMVYEANGRPVKGAYLLQARGQDYQDWIDKELTLYPDNYIAYYTKWRLVRSFAPLKLKHIIEADIQQVSSQIKSAPLDWLQALVRGYLWLGQETKSLEILRAMVKKYPNAAQTGNALSFYMFESSAEMFTGTGQQEVNQLALGYMKRNPASSAALQLATLSNDNVENWVIQEMVLRRWIADDPQNIVPYIELAEALNRREQHPEQVMLLTDKALKLSLQGKAKIQRMQILNRSLELLFLPQLYSLNAKAAFKLGKYAQALSAIKAAQSLNKETPADYKLLEGSIWEKAGMLTKAEQVYLKAWQLGSKEAAAALKSLYLQDGGAEDGFENWLSKRSVEDGATTPATAAKKSFANFSVTTLAGKKYELTALRGKVVALNFWFISCGPCRKEMPELNKLVKEYEHQGVVFLAATFEDVESIKAFQKEKEFIYEIIPNAQSWIDELGVNAYPTHYVLNGQGKIELMLLGGSDKNIEQIRNLLARLVPTN